jgi:hypothetical protein
MRANKRKRNKMIDEALEDELLAQSEIVNVKDALAAVNCQDDAAANAWGVREQAMFCRENELRQNLQMLQTKKKLPDDVGRSDVFLAYW